MFQEVTFGFIVFLFNFIDDHALPISQAEAPLSGVATAQRYEAAIGRRSDSSGGGPLGGGARADEGSLFAASCSTLRA
jgi:hypothetical protein